ncbi:MAG: hypothetical protein DI543_08885 [Bradyrhizobium icense]|jgi:hypothetical protein|nr:MAG: hypothetical protein DI543_08885 [Bradyrhizobium icense]
MERESPAASEAETEAEIAWNMAQKALAEAQRIPGGAERNAALREVGKLRFQADKLRRAAEAELQANTSKTRAR